MRAFFFGPEKKSCIDNLVDAYVSKCPDITDCHTTLTVTNISKCDTFPDKTEMELALRKVKGLDRAAYVNVETKEENFPYLAIRTCAYK